MWHLLAGDASVIPAISTALARIAAGRPVCAVIEIDRPAEEQPLFTEGVLSLRWLHRTLEPGEEPDLLVDAVRGLELPPGSGQAFVHGEASSVRTLRRHLFVERGLSADALSASGTQSGDRPREAIGAAVTA